MKLVAAADGREGSLAIHADVSIYAGLFDGAERAELLLDDKRLAYVHVARGSVSINGLALTTGDAAKLSGENRLFIDQGREAEVLVFDLQP